MNKENLKRQIELLVKDDESNQQTIINQRQEIERLNNIINELEDKNIRKLDFIEEKTFSKRQNGMTSEDRRLLDSNFKEIGNKINEIIDYINGSEMKND